MVRFSHCRPFNLRPCIILCTVLLAIGIAGCKKKPAPIVITPDIEKNHLQRNHIFGTVKEIETKTYYLAADSVNVTDSVRIEALLASRKPDMITRQRYSSDGYLLRYHKLDSMRTPVLHRIYRYDDDAKLNNWNEYDADNVTVATGLCLYDRNRFLIGEQIFHNDTLVMAFSYTNDGIGNIINSTQSNDDYITHTEYRYNECGLVSKITEYEPNGRPFKTVKIEYDNYGDEVNRCVYKAGNQMIEYTYTEYDQDGRLIQIIYNDKLHRRKEYSKYSDYDSQLNWQTEQKQVNNKIISIRKRKIIYY